MPHCGGLVSSGASLLVLCVANASLLPSAQKTSTKSQDAINMNTLYVTYCSGAKHKIEAGNPKELYNSRRITNFIQMCEAKQYKWAILSAKYGLFFPEERRNNYNATFKTVAYKCRVLENDRLLSEVASRLRVQELAEQVKKSLFERKIKHLVFLFEQPLQRRRCYLSVLHQAIDDCRIEHAPFNELKQHLNHHEVESTCAIELSDSI